MNKINLKDLVPHLIAVVVFVLITVIFFHPIFFENKGLSQHDILQGLGTAKTLKDYRELTGEEGLWAGSVFSGMPGYLINLIYSGDLVIHLQQAFTLWLPHPTSLLFLSFISCYILLLSNKVRPYLSMAGAIAFGMTGFQIISYWAGHNSKAAAVAIMPLVLAGIILAFRGRLGLGFIITAFGLAMQIRVNHLQITYYLLIICLVFGINELIIRAKNGSIAEVVKPLSVLVLAAILAMGTSFGRLWGVYEYSQYSTRGKSELTTQNTNSSTSGLDKDYAFQYSNGIFEPIFLFIPNFFGGSTSQDLDTDSNLAEVLRRNGAPPAQVREQIQNIPTYWGDQPSTAPYYAGAITVFLFVLALLVLPGKHKWWLVFLAILGIMLSWGKSFSSFNYFLFDYLPGYNKFRSVTFTIIITVFAMVLLGFTGLEKLLSDGWNKSSQKKLLIALGITGGFALVSALLAGMGSYVGGIDFRLSQGAPDWFMQAIREDREALLRADSFRSLSFVLVASGLIWLGMKKLLNLNITLIGLAAFVLIDQFVVDKRLLKSDSFTRDPKREFFAETEADKFIKTDKNNHYRVLYLPNPFNDARTSYHHRSIGGYHGAKMRRYQDLIEAHLQPELQEVIVNLRNGNVNFNSQGVINMLDTRYFIAGSRQREVIGNEAANGPAWFVQQVKKVSTPDEELSDLGNANTKVVAIVNTSKFEINDSEGYFSGGTIELVQEKPNHLIYDVDAAGNAFAVFSEIYYPKGWTATIDGNQAEIIQANYVLRALEIPEGKHRVEFRYEPASYTVGNMVMWFSSILLIVLSLWIGFRVWKTQSV